MTECKVCGGELTLLGRLGCLLHFRCRNCGAETHRKTAPARRAAKAYLRRDDGVILDNPTDRGLYEA